MIAFNLENTNFFGAYATDADAENNGVWVDGKPPIAVKVRSTRSKIARDAQYRIDKRNLPHFKNGAPLPESLEAQNEADIAIACLVDWRGVTDDSGAEIPFSAELARQLLSDTRFWEFRRFVIGTANNTENFRKAPTPAAANA